MTRKLFIVSLLLVLMHLMPLGISKEEKIEASRGKYRNRTEFSLRTPGCTVPRYNLRFKDSGRRWKCGKRLVNVEKILETLIFTWKVPFRKCCYSYLEDFLKKNNHRSCNSFWNGTKIRQQNEFLFVNCTLKDLSSYMDYFAFVKKRKLSEKAKLTGYSVLILGIDTISRKGAHQSLRQTVSYLKINDWLEFKRYHKSDKSTQHNLIPMLTGRSYSQYRAVKCASNKTICNQMLIWKQFEDAGYITAFAEDTIHSIFKTPRKSWMHPTQHHLTPLFKFAGAENSNSVCVGRRHAGLVILDYVLDFSKTYSNHNFFQAFWISSLSYSQLKHADLHFKSFFVKLERSGILNNTFVIFLSDHGYNRNWVPAGKYYKPFLKSIFYDENSPMFFMWVPPSFGEKNPRELASLRINQNRLTSVYDVYMTLFNVLILDDDSQDIIISEGCATSASLFQEISNLRICKYACIKQEFCTCLQEPKENKTAATRYRDLDSIRLIKVYVSEEKTLNRHKAKATTSKEMIRRPSVYDIKRRPYGAYNFRARMKLLDERAKRKLLEPTTESNCKKLIRLLAAYSTPDGIYFW